MKPALLGVLTAVVTLAALLLASEVIGRSDAVLAGIALITGLLVSAILVALRELRRAERHATARAEQLANVISGEVAGKAGGSGRLQDRLRTSAQRQRRLLSATYLQLEALTQVKDLIQPSLPLPAARGWAMSPDMIRVVVRLIMQESPGLIVEAGSGLSTLCFAYAQRRSGGSGRIVSLDHDAEYGARTRALLAQHGLGDIADVRIAPLTPQPAGDATWSWYEPSAWSDLLGIDLLIIDGPPGSGAVRARWPAVPLLGERLDPSAVVLLDDGARADETAIGAEWASIKPGWELRTLATEKGTIAVGPPNRLAEVYL